MINFSPIEAVRVGWQRFWQRPWFFVGVAVVVAVVSGVANQLTHVGGVSGATTVIVVGAGFIVSFIVSLLVKMGTINVFLKAHESVAAAQFEDLWAPAHLVSFVITSILVGAIVIVGLILLIVPGIMWALRYMFAQYLVVDRGLRATNALSESARLTDGHKWRLLGLILLLVLINIIGALCLLIGLLVTIPVSGLAIVHAYRALSRNV